MLKLFKGRELYPGQDQGRIVFNQSLVIQKVRYFYNYLIIPAKNTNKKYIDAGCQGSVSTFHCGSICEHLLFVQYKTKTKKFADLVIFFRGFFILPKSKIFGDILLKLCASINLPCEVPQKNVGPFSLVIWTFIGYKQTDK